MMNSSQAQLHITGMSKDYVFKQKQQVQEKTKQVSDQLTDWEIAINKVCLQLSNWLMSETLCVWILHPEKEEICLKFIILVTLLRF